MSEGASPASGTGGNSGGGPAGNSGRRRFRPTLWATLVTLPVLAVLLALGTWQLDRLDWKNDMIAQRTAGLAAPAVPLPNPMPDAERLAFAKVQVSGSFLHDKELYLGSRTHKKAVGYHVVTPFLLEDGRTLWIDRGWVPPDRRDPAARAAGQIGGQLRVEGILLTDGWKGSEMFKPQNRPEEKLFLWVDTAAMARRAGLDDFVAGVYLVAGPTENPGGLPIGDEFKVDLKNDHLEYAMTWYALAVVLGVIYFLFHFRPARQE